MKYYGKLFVALFILSISMFVVFAENNIEVSINAKVITVNGTTVVGAGKAVTILVRDSSSNIIYIDQGVSGQDNSYEFIFSLPSNALSGDYTVLIGGEGIASPTTRTFTYVAGDEPEDEPVESGALTAEVSINGKVVTVNGTTEAGTGKAVTILVRDSSSKIVYIDQGVSGSGNNYSFIFSMPDSAESGIYEVRVGGDGITTALVKTFNYNPNNPIDDETITAQVNINGSIVTVNGTTDSGVGKAVTILVRDANSNIVYIDQGISQADKSFEFSFTMPSTALNGIYTVLIGGEGIKSPISKTFTYDLMGGGVMTAQVNINGNVITINGATNSGVGKAVTLLVRDANSNIVYIDQELSGADKSFKFIFTLPSNAINGTYTVLIGGEGIQTPVSKSFVYIQNTPGSLTAPVLLTVQDSDITNTTVNLNWSASQGGTGAIFYSVYVNGTKYSDNISGTSYIAQNLLPNTSYNFKVVAKDTTENTVESNTLNVTTKEITAVDNGTLQLNCASDKEYDVIVIGKNVTDLSNKVYIVNYDPQKLEIIDMCSLTKAIDNTVSNIIGTDIVIIENDSQNGIIKFKLNRNYEGKQWTGVVNAIRFKSLAGSGTTAVNIN